MEMKLVSEVKVRDGDDTESRSRGNGDGDIRGNGRIGQAMRSVIFDGS